MTTRAVAELESECRALALDLAPGVLSADPELAVTGIVRRAAPLLDSHTREQVVRRIVDRLMGLGPLEPLLESDDISEIMINGPGSIWVDRGGVLEQSDVHVDRAAIDHLVERVVAPLGRRLDRTSPTVDGRLADGSRVHVVAQPIALDGPYVTVRRFRLTQVSLAEVATRGTAALLRWAVRARSNILVSGGTSTGKTTLLNSLAGLIDGVQRVVTIEDAAELQLPLPHVVRLEARPATVDGPPAVSIRELVRNALRMRPDRIVVGEVRGAESLDMVQAMNTGHDGSLSTCHANGPADALRRLEAMIAMGDAAVPLSAAHQLVNSAIDIVVHLERDELGARRVAAVAEPCDTGSEGVRVLADARGLVALPGRPARRAAEPLDPSVLEANR